MLALHMKTCSLNYISIQIKTVALMILTPEVMMAHPRRMVALTPTHSSRCPAIVMNPPWPRVAKVGIQMASE